MASLIRASVLPDTRQAKRRDWSVGIPGFTAVRRLGIAGMTGAAIITCMIVMAVAVPLVSPYGIADTRSAERLREPEFTHPFGTDRLGRDQFTRAAAAGRTSLTATFLALALSLTIGVGLGLLAGHAGGAIDMVVMRVADVIMALPTLVLGIVVAALFGPALLTVVIATVSFWWAGYARVTRTLVRQVGNEPFVEASRAIGATPWRIATREVLPHIWGPIIVMAALDVGSLLMTLSGLSFLGLGAQPPTPEWGLMLADGRAYFLDAPFLMFFPGLMIFLCVLGVNLLGTALRQRITTSV